MADDALLRRFFLDHLNIWRRAIEVQRERAIVARSDLDREIDAHFFPVALRNLVRIKDFARPYAMSKVDTAWNAFKKAVPDSVDVRDALEHFDAYEVDKGKLQIEGTFTQRSVWYAADVDQLTFHVGTMTVNVADATTAALALATELEAVLTAPRNRTS